MAGSVRNHLVIDADAHVMEPEEAFDARFFSAKYKDRRPRIVERDGLISWLVDDDLFPRLKAAKGLHYMGIPPRYKGVDHPFTKVKWINDSARELTDVKDRLAVMDKSGLDIQVIHNSFFFAYPTSWGAGDPKLGSAICASYNSWIAEKCAQSGGRLSFSAVVCLDDLEGAIAEVKRAKGLGASSIYVNGTIGEKKLARAENDRFFQALCDNDIPLTVHIGWCFPALTDLMDTPYEARVVSLILPLLVGFSDVISADILTRFDTLSVGFLEGGCDWIPFMVDQLENIYQVFTKRLNWAPRQLSNSPLEIIRTNPRLFFGTEPESHLLPDVIKEIGNKFVCGSDMPHTETTDTRSKHMVILDRDDLSDVDKRKIVDTNPKAFFRVTAWEKMQARALSQAAE